jgi:hypothetical protein
MRARRENAVMVRGAPIVRLTEISGTRRTSSKTDRNRGRVMIPLQIKTAR